MPPHPRGAQGADGHDCAGETCSSGPQAGPRRAGRDPVDLRGGLSRAAQTAARRVRAHHRAVPRRGRAEPRGAGPAGHRAGAHRRDPRARPARRPCCSTATTTSCPRGTRRCGPRRRSSPSSATARSTAAAARTPRPTSSPTSARCARGTGRPPVGIKLVIEGQEEVGGGALTTYPPTAPEAFAADAMVIGDMGSVRPGVPTLTVALRGMAMVTVEVTTLAGAKHSGQFGGAAPDALLALLRALGDAARRRRRTSRWQGLRREEWDGRVLQRRRVPGAGRGPRRDAADRHGRARLARVVGAGDHRHRHRRAERRQRAQRRVAVRARRDQPARASRAGRGSRPRRRSSTICARSGRSGSSSR